MLVKKTKNPVSALWRFRFFLNFRLQEKHFRSSLMVTIAGEGHTQTTQTTHSCFFEVVPLDGGDCLTRKTAPDNVVSTSSVARREPNHISVQRSRGVVKAQVSRVDSPSGSRDHSDDSHDSHDPPGFDSRESNTQRRGTMKAATDN